MAKYLNRAQLKSASDKEIEQFFSETYFEGIFSHEIRSSNVAYYKGCITNIQLEGKLTNIAPSFINVPLASNYVPEGPCTFKCKLDIDAFRGKPSKYIIRLIGRSLKSIDSLSSPLLEKSEKNTKDEDLYEMWGVNDCQCIGYYHYDDKSQKYVVDDLRKPNFDHIPYYPGDMEKRPIRITYPHEIRGIRLNDYYLFTWKLSHKNKYNPYEIYLDFSTQPRTKMVY